MESKQEYVALIQESKEEDQTAFTFNSSELECLFLILNFPFHVIAVAGFQSTGKSTLLNSAFGLRFPTMDASNQSQTTRGIYIGMSTELRLTCLDMEGADSRERDDDNESYIERMISAFGLMVSNLLIYNIFVRDINSRAQKEFLANMITHYLRISNEKKTILFCIRDMGSAQNEDDIENKVTMTFEAALNLAKKRLKEESKSQAFSAYDYEMINEVFQVNFAFISNYSVKDRKFDNEEEVMNRFRETIQRILRDTQPVQGNTIARLWGEIWNKIHSNELTNYRELFIQATWESLKQEFISRCSELSNKIQTGNGYNHNKEFAEVDSEFKSRIDQNFKEDTDIHRSLRSFYADEYQEQATSLKSEMEHYRELFIQATWESLQREFISRCSELSNNIKAGNDYDYENELINLDTEFISRINHNFGNEPDIKQALDSFYSVEYRNQSIELEKEKFKRSLERYFNDDSEETINLYSDLIKIYTKVNCKDKAIDRFMKFTYFNYLTNSAISQDLYNTVIGGSIKAIHDRFTNRIQEIDTNRLNLSDVSIYNPYNQLNPNGIDKSIKVESYRDIISLAYRQGKKELGTVGSIATTTFGVALSPITFPLMGKIFKVLAGSNRTEEVSTVIDAVSIYWTRKGAIRELASINRRDILNHSSIMTSLKEQLT